MFQKSLFIGMGLMLALSSCTPEALPKPKAYPRVYLPEAGYVPFTPQGCPFSFEMPVYGIAERDSFYLGKSVESECWYNLRFDTLNAVINLTYKSIGDTIRLERLIDDAYRLSFKHSKKADYIDETVIQNPSGLGGVIYEVGGNAASSVQFFLTDSTRHFVRGALYFNSEPNIDSMKPVIAFMRKDLDHLIRTFRME